MNEPVALGEVLVGKYRVERLLGKGGMGVVVAVRHVDLGQLHAMKLLLPAALENQEAHERFLREARAAARLTSDHVVRVQDVGYMDNGVPYMIMEYLEGCDLKALVSKQGRLSVVEAVTYVLQVCEAMIEAHAAGIVHRDLKPANLFLVRRRFSRPFVKVLDFGISKQTGPKDTHLTHEHATLGSPLYMAPEQMIHARTVDGRADIWALGVILYELLTGLSPFEGHSIVEVVSRVSQEEPTPLRELQADIPEDLEKLVNKCLRKRAAERFQTMQQLQVALARFGPPDLLVQHPAASTTPPEPIGNARTTVGEATQIVFGRAGKPVSTKVPPYKLMTFALALLLAGVVFGSGIMHAVTLWTDDLSSTSASVPLSNSSRAVRVDANGLVPLVEEAKSAPLPVSLLPSCSGCVIVEPPPTTVKSRSPPAPSATVKMRTNITKRHRVN